jgi:Recombinase
MEGKTAYAIARDLNRDAVPTAQGARAWSQATVRALLMRKAFIDYGHRGLRRPNLNGALRRSTHPV